MKKDPDHDLQSPDEAAVEERVRRMMDIAVPDESERPATSAVPPPKKAPAPAPAKSKPLIIKIADELDAATVSAPPLPAEKSEPPKSKKSIVIKHFTETSEKADAPDGGFDLLTASKKASRIKILPVDDEEALEPVDNPLIPTDKLASTIKPAPVPAETDAGKTDASVASTKKTAKTSSKSKAKKAKTDKKPDKPAVLPETSEVSEEPEETEATIAPFTDIDTEIAEAFDAPQDELDMLASEDDDSERQAESVEPPVEPTDEVPSAPELPAGFPTEETAEESEEEAETQPARKPKFDKFTPLTDIRPHMPKSEDKRGPLELDDAETSKAVEEIMFSEADRVLETPAGRTAAEAAPQQAKTEAKPEQQTRPRRKIALKRLVLACIVLGIALGLALPVSRVPLLNAVGLRTKLVTTAIDQSTGQPLKDVTVSVGGQTRQTDETGKVTFTRLKLGKAHLAASRRAYAGVERDVNLGLTTTTLPAINLVPNGTQFTLNITDYFTNKPVKAQADSGLGSANADQNGVLKLTIDKSQTKPFQVTLSAPGYRTEKLTLDPAKAAQKQGVKLVLARRYAFINRQSGTYDVYGVDLDGQNQQLILKGTGTEQAKTTTLVSDPTSDLAALISVRSSAKAADGTSISTLSLLNLTDATTATIAQGTQLEIVGWSGNSLVYAQVLADSKAADPSRQQLISYDTKSKKSLVLAKANYFNNVLLTAGKVYFAPSSAYQAADNVGFFQINPDGSGKAEILPLETWNVYRNSFTHLNLSVQQDWYDYKLGDKLANKQAAAPPSLNNILYIESPDGQHALWVNEDGAQPKLTLYDKKTDKNADLISEDGIKYPVRWLSADTLIYRVSTANETADYVYSLSGGVPQKVHDLTDINGITAWQIH